MEDAIIKHTGNSRYLKSVANFLQLYPTYESMVKALVAGTLPVDFNGFNASGFTTLGTPLNKATFLKDQTATALDLHGNPTVDDALYKLYESLPTAPLSSDLLQFINGTHPILCAAPLKQEKVAYVRWKFYTFDEITATIKSIVKDEIAKIPRA